MNFRFSNIRDLSLGTREARGPSPRKASQTVLSCESLEGRVTPSHFGAVPFGHAAPPAQEFGTPFGSHGTSGGGSSSSNSTLKTAIQTLQTEVQTIESSSGTTVGELTAIRTSFQTLASDGLRPSSRSALQSFENGLVTAYASGTTLTGNATLLSQFEAIYTSSPTPQQTTDLTTAYNALAAAVTSSGITSADITAINTDFAAVLSAAGSTSTATFPYFTLVTGMGGGPGFGGGHMGGGC